MMEITQLFDISERSYPRKYYDQREFPFRMTYKLPTDEEVTEAIKRTLARHALVNSQRKLTEFVRKELSSMDPDYAVAEERVRRLAIESGIARIGIIARDSEDKTVSNTCPVCDQRMKRVRNLTVYGGSVNIGYRCSRCGYWTGIKARRPVRYVFSLKA